MSDPVCMDGSSLQLAIFGFGFRLFALMYPAFLWGIAPGPDGICGLGPKYLAALYSLT